MVVLLNSRRRILISLYTCSILLSLLLIYLAGLHCQLSGMCRSTAIVERTRYNVQVSTYHQVFPLFIACTIAFLSVSWLVANLRTVENSCLRDYNYLEMPSAVFSALLAGVCGVVEIHYNFDIVNLYWSEKWTLTSADSMVLVLLHAGLAFALT